MSKIRNLIVFSGIAGGGSIALTYFVPATWRFLSIIGIMIMSVLLAIQAVVSDDGASNFRLQLSPTRAPSGSDADVESNESSVFYYVFGVLLFGTIALLFVI